MTPTLSLPRPLSFFSLALCSLEFFFSSSLLICILPPFAPPHPLGEQQCDLVGVSDLRVLCRSHALEIIWTIGSAADIFLSPSLPTPSFCESKSEGMDRETDAQRSVWAVMVPFSEGEDAEED